jgi:hypothetical protein
VPTINPECFYLTHHHTSTKSSAFFLRNRGLSPAFFSRPRSKKNTVNFRSSLERLSAIDKLSCVTFKFSFDLRKQAILGAKFLR